LDVIKKQLYQHLIELSDFVEVVKVGIMHNLQKAMRQLENIKDKVIEHVRKLMIKVAQSGGVGIGTGIVFGLATGGPIGAIAVGGIAAICTWGAGTIADGLMRPKTT